MQQRLLILKFNADAHLKLKESEVTNRDAFNASKTRAMRILKEASMTHMTSASKLSTPLSSQTSYAEVGSVKLVSTKGTCLTCGSQAVTWQRS